jgi:hypothetical protein
LTFWIGGILGRFLRRKRQSRVLGSGAAVGDRPEATDRMKLATLTDWVSSAIPAPLTFVMYLAKTRF